MPSLGIGLSLPEIGMRGGSAPFILLSAGSQAENTSIGTTIGTLSVVGGSGSYTFAKTVDGDSAFTLTTATLSNAASYNYEVKTFHTATFTANNGVNPIITATLTVQVTNVIETPANLTLPAITGTVAVGQTLSASNGTWTDMAGPGAATYAYQWKAGGSSIGGATSSTFLLTHTQAAAVITCSVTPTNTAGAGSAATSSGTAAVSEVPVFTSSATFSVAEGSTTVGTATTAQASTFGISGTDASLLAINASTGAITFATAPSFTSPADAGANNVYDLVITATSVGTAETKTQTVAVTVTVVAAVLSSPTAAAGNTTAALGVSTTKGDGVLYWIITTDATPPNAANIIAGVDQAINAAAAHGSQAVSATGAQSASATGLSNGVTYYAYFAQTHGGTNSNVDASASFAPVAFPSGALGNWNAANYVSSPRKIIPNSITNGTSDPNLATAPRRLFSIADFWGQSNLTITDSNVTAPDGTGDATTIVGSGNWNLCPIVATSQADIPAGTYTVAVSVKWLGTGSQSFKLGTFGGTIGTFTATGSWQRFNQTFTVAGHPFVILQTPDGTSSVNFAICDYELFSGSSDLNTNALTQAPLSVQNRDWSIGNSTFDSTSSVSAGAFVNGSRGLIQFGTLQTPSAFTLIYIAKRTGSPTSASYNPIVARPNIGGATWSRFAVGPCIGGPPGSEYAGANIDLPFTATNQLNDSLWGRAGGVFIAAHRYDGTTASAFINGVKLLNHTTTVSAQTFYEWYTGYLQSTFKSGYSIYQVVYWGRALSDAEIRTAYSTLAAQTTTDTPRTIAFEGTSITSGTGGTSVGFIIGPNLSPVGYGAVYGTGGATLSTLSARAATLDAIITGAPTQKFILSLEVGANDLGSNNAAAFTTALATYCDARRTAGWKVVLHTILARLDAGDGGIQFNLDRATANATISTWVGTHGDALADWASNATMGTDTAPNNSTYFNSDKIHPKSAGYVLLEPYDRTAINGL